MTGGGMLPVIFMPKWLLTISHFSPVKWSILAIEGGIWRDFTLSELALPAGILVGIGLVCYIIGVSILSRSDA
jgi:ABC-2 type transport system permease protein